MNGHGFAFAANSIAAIERNAPKSGVDVVVSDNDTLCKIPLLSREAIVLGAQSKYSLAAIIRRFLAKVHKTVTCWLWTGAAGDAYGHGAFTIRHAGIQHHFYAHRLAWVLSGRILPSGLQLCHKCDVGRCIRPGHLFLGTQRDNLDDAIAKGRLVCGCGARKLSDDAYREILARPFQHGTGKVLAQKYGVTRTTISRIRNGRQGSTYRAGHRTGAAGER